MTQLLAPIALLGLGDSLNPATIAVAVLLATQRHAAPRLLAYTLGTGLTYFLGGVVLMIGPAALLQTLAHHHVGHRTRIVEVLAGLVVLAVAAWLWTRPGEAVARRVPDQVRTPHAFALGAVITAIDLPTALMYFAAIGIVAAADITVGSRVALLAVFNAAYVAPLLTITLAVAVLGDRAAGTIVRVRDVVARWSTRLLAVLTAAAGVYLVVAGLRGLA